MNPSAPDFASREPTIFHVWHGLPPQERTLLERELAALDLDRLEQQKCLVQAPKEAFPSLEAFEAFEDFSLSGDRDDQRRGQQLAAEGRLGCLLLAGGEGSRLRHSEPKGFYPISVVKRKSLFQLVAEKVGAAGRRAGRPLRLAIMTSPENDKTTRLFFESHAYFGLAPSQVVFFVQERLPLLDAEGHLFLTPSCKVAMAPDGNGGSLIGFAKSGCLERWRKEGIEYLHVVPIDNPLADPFDAELVGFHHRQGAEATLKCTEKEDPEEKVGLLVKQKGRCRVVEYSEMDESEARAKDASGRLKHRCANLSLFCFSLSFIDYLHSKGLTIPLHRAWKAVAGRASPSEPPSFGWKFETFIFDWLQFTTRTAALVYPRSHCFAPLKNLTGPDSPDAVQQALQQRDREVWRKVTGQPPPAIPFEVDAEWYYT